MSMITEPRGQRLAQRLTSALTNNGIPDARLVELIYGELSAIAKEQFEGDWLECPDGTTYTLTFTPKGGAKHDTAHAGTVEK